MKPTDEIMRAVLVSEEEQRHIYKKVDKIVQRLLERNEKRESRIAGTLEKVRDYLSSLFELQGTNEAKEMADGIDGILNDLRGTADITGGVTNLLQGTDPGGDDVTDCDWDYGPDQHPNFK